MNRVVVTGMGTVNPLGSDVSEFWDNVVAGKCGINKISSFNADDYEVKCAGEIKEFHPEKYTHKRELKRLDMYSQYAIYAAHQAYEDAKLGDYEIDRERIGVIVSSGIGGIQTFYEQTDKMISKGHDRVSPYFIPMMIANMAAGNIAIALEAKGPCLCVVTACASGTNAIGEAFHKIRHGEIDIAITGGTEASINEIGISGFMSMKALSTSNNPLKASIPFDKDRDGFVMGEGSGVLVLESLENAQKRGAKIYAEIVGYSSTCDAHHITSPAPEGEGGMRAMKNALKDANLNTEDVSYINAHGTSTYYNDLNESLAIKALFKTGDNIVPPVSSTKSMIGHLLGASGAVEAIVCVKAIQDSVMPPTIGYTTPDPDCDLDYIPNKARKSEVNVALSNSLGFGGHNATIIFKKFSE
ncbi:beta-ketoacyl-ACP synthase II [Alkalibaculum sp. M08DMB]|uniref:3-oxoacyl-[acyl-carrier-protein] synthase 2 n=1 Tax=Alkalibaculum sporogenes TaxID=2655001 RepID=A0A6A7KA53_9FIRM|nr:beta-ketoacyl-ACP synthase II [Alkalibaculum sporogenes]MPW26388.1 beta-ketoacyl-ACP synthase II [Alkalibaculum sporogenes]